MRLIEDNFNIKIFGFWGCECNSLVEVSIVNVFVNIFVIDSM